MLVVKKYEDHFKMWKESGWKQSVSKKQLRKFAMNIAKRIPHDHVVVDKATTFHIWTNRTDAIHIGWGESFVWVVNNGEEFYINDLSGLNYVRRQILA